MSRRRFVSTLLASALLAPNLAAVPALAQRVASSSAPETHGVGQRFEITLGLPPAPVRVHTSTTPEGVRIELRGRGRPARVTFPTTAAATVGVNVKRLSSGAGVGIVTVGAGEARFAAIVTARAGRPIVLYQGRLDLVGDHGERRGAQIETEDRTGDGAPDVIVGLLREDTAICGQPAALLDPRAVHPRELTLVPVLLRRLPERPPEGEREVLPTTDSPGPAGTPLVDALHFRRASSVAGRTEDAIAPVPTGLTDGNAATAWIEGGGNGTWEFATATWAGGEGLPIRAFAIVPRPTGSLSEHTRSPRALWLVGDHGPRLRVPLPPDLAPGQVLWIVPPEPLAWRCVSVVLDAGPAGDRTSYVGIAELHGYSEVDFGRGVPYLVAELSAGVDRADHAEALLGGLGLPAVEALRAAFDDMPPGERMRAVRAYGRLARSVPEALRALADAAMIATDAEVAAEAREALLRLGEEGARALASIAARDPSGPSLLALARHRPDLAIAPILSVLEGRASATPTDTREGRAGAMPDPQTVRSALTLTVRRAPEHAAAALDAFLAEPRSLDGLTIFAEALVDAGPDGQPFAERALLAALEHAEGFEVRYRIARTAKALAEGRSTLDPRITSFLRKESRAAEEWMMRAIALEALAGAGASHDEVLAAGLDDAYPRVRSAALMVLAERLAETSTDTMPANAERRAWMINVAMLARRDPFPFVRAEALEALAHTEEAKPVIEAALGDRAERVRAAAIHTLAARGDADAWPAVEARLRNEDEWPVVTDAAIEFAERLCIAPAVEALTEVVRRAERPQPWEPDVTSAGLALRALSALGTPNARAALREAARSERLHAAAIRALERAPTCAQTFLSHMSPAAARISANPRLMSSAARSR